MTFDVNVSGTWHESHPHANVGGTWHEVQTGWVNVGGVWKQFYQAAVYSAGPGGSHTDEDTFSFGQASLTLNIVSNGSADVEGVNSGQLASWNWITPTSASTSQAYTAEVIVNSGSSLGGSATGVDVPISGSPSWSLTSFGGTKTTNLTLNIKDANGTLVATQNYTFEVIE